MKNSRILMLCFLLAQPGSVLAHAESELRRFQELAFSPMFWTIGAVCCLLLWFVLTKMFQSEFAQTFGGMFGAMTIICCFGLAATLVVPHHEVYLTFQGPSGLKLSMPVSSVWVILPFPIL